LLEIHDGPFLELGIKQIEGSHIHLLKCTADKPKLTLQRMPHLTELWLTRP
jgi:hypothetical protein